MSDINARLDELEKTPIEEPEEPSLLSLEFLADANPMQLTANVKGEIIGDSIVDCWVPNIMSDKLLIPQAEYVGESIMFDDVPATIGSTSHDFKKPVKMTITNGNKSKDYIIYVHSYTGLPVMWIETEGRQEITSKEEYLRASFKLVEDVRTRAVGDVIVDSVNIKGRGNRSWLSPKKSYRLKFDKKVSLLDEPEDKSWVLISNYDDKTMLRNEAAFYMGRISNLEYTPKTHFVELFLNGRYNGTYLLAEKIKVAKHRVDIGNDGYLMEIDAQAPGDESKRYFYLNHLTYPISIIEPALENDNANFNYISNYLIVAENVLFSDGFKDPVNGWQKFFDIESLVDWYLIHEIAKNYDSFWASCYMSLNKGDKIKMGPIWDFDQAFCTGKAGSPEGFYVRYSCNQWMERLYEDPVFVSKCKERFNYFYNAKLTL